MFGWSWSWCSCRIPPFTFVNFCSHHSEAEDEDGEKADDAVGGRHGDPHGLSFTLGRRVDWLKIKTFLIISHLNLYVYNISIFIHFSYNRAAHTCICANMGVYVVFTWPKPYFNVHALIFYMCEGSSQAITHAKKLWN